VTIFAETEQVYRKQRAVRVECFRSVEAHELTLIYVRPLGEQCRRWVSGECCQMERARKTTMPAKPSDNCCSHHRPARIARPPRTSEREPMGSDLVSPVRQEPHTDASVLIRAQRRSPPHLLSNWLIEASSRCRPGKRLCIVMYPQWRLIRRVR
jgi:hypothetical protein